MKHSERLSRSEFHDTHVFVSLTVARYALGMWHADALRARFVCVSCVVVCALTACHSQFISTNAYDHRIAPLRAACPIVVRPQRTYGCMHVLAFKSAVVFICTSFDTVCIAMAACCMCTF